MGNSDYASGNMGSERAGGFGMPGDFDTLARQYWGAWGDAMRNAAPGAAQTTAQPWQDAIDWWAKFAHGGRPEADDMVSRFNQQARQWFGQMQQVAAQYAGRDAGAADITRAWKQALGAAGENPFPEMFRAMRGHRQQGFDRWMEDAAPYLEAWKRQGASWLQTPTFGLGREHQERLQALAQAQMDYQQHNADYNALMMQSAQSAYEIFERKLAQRSEPGRQIESARALFDLWIDAAEEAYAQVALSPAFRKVYGKLVNAQMRLRSGIQREVEQMSDLFGMPTRTEVDGAYRKIAELERSVRKLRDAAQADSDRPVRAPAQRPQTGRSSDSVPISDKTAARPPAGGSTARKAPAKRKKPAARKVAPGKAIATPVAPRPLASKARKRR